MERAVRLACRRWLRHGDIAAVASALSVSASLVGRVLAGERNNPRIMAELVRRANSRRAEKERMDRVTNKLLKDYEKEI